MFNYDGRVVVVTGASTGLGEQMAEGFAQQGANIVLVARRMEKLEIIAKKLRKYGVKCLPLQCDVTDTTQVNKMVEETIKEFGKIDVLVNNAGGDRGGTVTEMSDEDWNFVNDLNLTSVFKVTRAVSKYMVKEKYGRIINISSMYGFFGTNQTQSAYHASKAGVINYTRAAAAELAPYGITCNSICPGYFPTDLTAGHLATPKFKAYIDITVPMQRPGRDGELNSGAIFLGSEEASYVTGVALPIDGGWSNVK